MGTDLPPPLRKFTALCQQSRRREGFGCSLHGQRSRVGWRGAGDAVPQLRPGRRRMEARLALTTASAWLHRCRPRKAQNTRLDGGRPGAAGMGLSSCWSSSVHTCLSPFAPRLPPSPFSLAVSSPHCACCSNGHTCPCRAFLPTNHHCLTRWVGLETRAPRGRGWGCGLPPHGVYLPNAGDLVSVTSRWRRRRTADFSSAWVCVRDRSNERVSLPDQPPFQSGRLARETCRISNSVSVPRPGKQGEMRCKPACPSGMTAPGTQSCCSPAHHLLRACTRYIGTV